MTVKAKPTYEELERRIQELEKAESELSLAKDHFKKIFDNAQDAIFIHDLEGKIFDVNDKMCRMYGLTKGEALEVTIEDVSSSRMSMKVLLERWQKVLNGEKLFFEWEARRPKDKSVLNVEVSIQKISFRDKDIVLANVRDITESRCIENENLFLANIIKRSQDFICVADMEGNPFFVNPAGQALVGLNGDEAVKGTTIKDYFNDEDLPFVEETILPTLMTEGRWHGEFRFRHFKTGAPIPFLYDLFLTENPETGQVTNFTTISRDITDRKLSEEALRKSENHISSIFRSAPVGIGSVVNRVLSKVNNCLCEMTGYDETELIGQSTRMLYPSDKDFEFVGRKKYAQIADHGMGMVETRWQKKDGTIMDVLLSSTPVNLKDHSKGVTFTSLDITERKRGEDKLKSNYALLQIAGETAKFGGWSVDLENNICTWSDAVADIHDVPHGYAPPLQEAIHFYAPEWQEKIKQIFSACVKEGIPYDEEMEIITQKGKRVWVRATGKSVKNEKDKIIKVHGSIQDITGKKHTEKALKESEERFNLAMGASRDGVFEWDLETREVYYSPGWKRMLGYGPDELPDNFSVWEKLTRPEDLKKSKQIMKEVLEGKRERFEVEFEMRHKDGHWIHILSRSNIYKDANGKPVRVVGTHVDITDSKQQIERLRLSESRYRNAQALAKVGNWEYNLKTTEFWGSDETKKIFGIAPDKDSFSTEEVESCIIKRERVHQAMVDLIENGKAYNLEFDIITKNTGKIKTVVSIAEIEKAGAKNRKISGVIHDITERKALEDQLLQAQKMESIGRLAGGVAHDFNNMLSVILGHTEMALEKLDPAEPLFTCLQAVQQAAKRSAALTRQLLAFARKQTVAPKVIDLNETVEGMLNMLPRLIGEDTDLAWLPGKKIAPVKLDPSQIDQIVANLCINARDAIAGVGKITIETAVVAFDEAYCAEHAGFKPGEYILLAVSDDGCGMDRETIGHIFEPFFTTKEQGKGTGLGLASVYGLVKQNNGFINVYSEPGQGTTVRIYLPRYAAKFASVAEKTPDRPAERGHETILLVEDELVILEMTTMMLTSLGYRVVAAATAGEAIRLAHEHSSTIDLLMTDVVMPEMNGRDLAGNLLAHFPDLKRLFMSGYTANVIAHHGVLDEGVHFIQKPFSMKDLGGKLREALEG